MLGTGGSVWDWLGENQWLVWTLTALSVVSLVLAIVLLPRIVARLPADYFKSRHRQRQHRSKGGWVLRIGKNLLGLAFVGLGILLLVLPGQGVLTLLIGVLLLDFPGKHALERWLVMRPGIRRFLDKMRVKRGKPRLQLE
jgi:Na+/H+ antiporter NhaD/arsenite permease-like protein